MDQICIKESIFGPKQKSEQFHQIQHIRISLSSKQTKSNMLNSMEMFIFSVLDKKCPFLCKFDPKNQSFILKVSFNIFEQICPKRVFSNLNSKKEHHYQIQHIRIDLSTKFHLKQTILLFLPNLLKKSIKNLVYHKYPPYSKFFYWPWNVILKKNFWK